MEKIRSFIYLDEYKMYSISSQIFEGITEYLIEHKKTSKEETESQKGPVGSGRIMADIINLETGTQEKKYLHDYSYKVFEDHLTKSGRVADITIENIENIKSLSEEYSFVKIRGNAVFNDISSLLKTLNNFNKIGESLSYVTNFKVIEEARNQLSLASSHKKDRNGKAKQKSEFTSLTDIKKLAKESGLQHDQKFLDTLAYLLEYGFQDQFEIQMPIDSQIFSANLKRQCLREEENLLIRKYSRIAEKEFIIFGMITQNTGKGEVGNKDEGEGEEKEFKNIKEALMNMVGHLANLESTFTGRLSNEIIIDPIAVYREL